jgi:hypothetical protein
MYIISELHHGYMFRPFTRPFSGQYKTLCMEKCTQWDPISFYVIWWKFSLWNLWKKRPKILLCICISLENNHSENNCWCRPTLQNCKLNNTFILISTASEMNKILVNNSIILFFKSVYLIMTQCLELVSTTNGSCSHILYSNTHTHIHTHTCARARARVHTQ